MDAFPVMRRELRRLKNPRHWLLFLCLGGLAMWDDYSPGRAAVAFTILAGLLAVYTSYRVLQAELEEKNIEHLAATPITPVSLFLQIGIGCATAWLCFSLAAVAVVSLTHDSAPAPVWVWLEGAALVVVLGCMAALGIFRFGRTAWENLVGWIPPGGVLLGFLFCVIKLLHPEHPKLLHSEYPAFPAFLAVPGILITGFMAWFGIYGLWRLMGGHWPESLDQASPRPRDSSPRPLQFIKSTIPWGRPVPDRISPLLWRELHQGLGKVLGCSALAVLGLLFARWMKGPLNHCPIWEIIGSVSWVIVIVVIAAASSRTEKDRRAGLWQDLAVSPVNPSEFIKARVLGILSQGMIVILPLFLFWMLCLAEPSLENLWQLVLATGALLILWTPAILAGSFGGCATSGWKAGLVGLGTVLGGVWLLSMLCVRWPCSSKLGTRGEPFLWVAILVALLFSFILWQLCLWGIARSTR